MEDTIECMDNSPRSGFSPANETADALIQPRNQRRITTQTNVKNA
jgi:hypothetical protein